MATATNAVYVAPNVEPVESRQIFINDISGDTTTSDLRTLFASAGKVTNVEIDTNELNRHFAFVTFETSHGVDTAISKFTTTQLKNTTLVCRKRTELEQMRTERMVEAQCKLFVGNIPQQMSGIELRREIQKLSQRPIADFRHKKGYCFVGYSTPKDAEDAKRNLKNAMCGGKALNAEFKKEDPIRNEPGFIAVLEQAQRTLYVRDIPQHSNPDYFKQIFEKYGKVRKFTLPTENRSNKLIGYAFIEYFWKEDCDKALAQTDCIQIDGVKIEIRISDPPKDKSSKSDDRDRRGRRDRRDGHRNNGMNRDRRDRGGGGRGDRRHSRFSRDNRRSRSRSRSRDRDRTHGGNNRNYYNNNRNIYDPNNRYQAQQPNPLYNRYTQPIPQQTNPYMQQPVTTLYNTPNPNIYNPYNPNTTTNTLTTNTNIPQTNTPTNQTGTTAATATASATTTTATPTNPYNHNPYGYNYSAYGYPYNRLSTQPTANTTNTATAATTGATTATTTQQQAVTNTTVPQTYPQYATQPNYYQQPVRQPNGTAITTQPATAATATASTAATTDTTQQQAQAQQTATAAYNYYNNVQPNAYAASYYQQQAANSIQQPTQQPNYTYPQTNYPYARY